MKTIITGISLMFFLGACATADKGTRSAERDELRKAYQDHAGESRSETVSRRVDAWFSLGREWLVLRSRDRQYYLITVDVACADDLRFGSTPRLATEQQSRNILTRHDRILMNERRCRINSIQKVDHKALAADLEEKGISHGFLRIRDE